MYRGFPASLIPALRCPRDSGALNLRDESAAAAHHIQQATLSCPACARSYPITDGIVRFLDPATLDDESNNERTNREQGAKSFDPTWETTAWNQMEIVPTIEASQPLAGAHVLELGAGTGRYTVQMADRQATILAVDFSLTSLEQLAARVQPRWDIGLVHADCTQFAVAPQSFDLVASTLVSNLPTPQHRAAMMRVAAAAVKKTGKFVFSTHHYGIRSRLRREPQSGYYREVPIYRYLFKQKEIQAETAPYFADIACHPIQVAIPLVTRLRLPAVTLSRLAERIPIINQLGELLLVVARTPRIAARA